MLDRIKVEIAWGAPTFDLDVVILVGTIRHRVLRQVRDTHQQIGELRILGFGLVVEGSNLGLFIGHEGA